MGISRGGICHGVRLRTVSGGEEVLEPATVRGGGGCDCKVCSQEVEIHLDALRGFTKFEGGEPVAQLSDLTKKPARLCAANDTFLWHTSNLVAADLSPGEVETRFGQGELLRQVGHVCIPARSKSTAASLDSEMNGLWRLLSLGNGGQQDEQKAAGNHVARPVRNSVQS